MRGFEVRVGYDQHPVLLTSSISVSAARFSLSRVGGDIHRHNCPYLDAAVLDGFLLEQAQDRQRQRLGVADRALAGTARADDGTGFAEDGRRRWRDISSRPNARYGRPARAPGISRASRTRVSTARWLRADSMSMKSMTTRPPMSRRRSCRAISSGGFQVGLQRGFLISLPAGRPGGVDVDGDQRLGGVDHDRATSGQPDFALEGGFDLAFDLEPVEQRDAVLVHADAAFVLGHDLADKIVACLKASAESISTWSTSSRR